MKVIAIYPGRFQPFHKGHAQVYQWLKNKFGAAIIATSSKVDPPKSPFNFDEKKKMMTLAGVTPSDIKQVTMPYIASEVLQNYDPKKTVIVFAVSQKDMDEDPRFNFAPTKSGKPGYLQPYKGNENKLKPFGDAKKPQAYVVVTPTFTFDVLGQPAKSATEIRKQFASADNETQKKLIKDLFGKYDSSVHKLMKEKIKKQKTLKEARGLDNLIEESRMPAIGQTFDREIMPQIKDVKSFASHLSTLSIPYQSEVVPTSQLKGTQVEYNPQKIDALKSVKNKGQIVVSNDDHVLDGHHRWIADHETTGKSNCLRVDMPILDLVKTAHDFNNRKKSPLMEHITHDEFQSMLDKFVQFAADYLKLKKIPVIHFKKDKSDIVASFGGYSPHNKDITVATKDRHPMDIFRTVAHELTHAKQDEMGHVEKAGDKAGDTGHPLENEANAEAGIILRHYGRQNPEIFKLKYVAESFLNEGINDRSTFKAVFLAGGPGSGKDFILNKTIAGTGLSEINSDVAFEFLMKREGLDPKMPDSEETIRNIVRGRSKNIAREKQRLALAGRLGIIINGTADDAEEMALLKQGLEGMGYETMMIFVDTSDEVSKQRNIERGERGGRTVKEKIRKEKWDAAQEAKPKLEKVFGKENFIVIDNSQDVRQADPKTKKKIEDSWKNAFKQVRKFTSTPVDNNAANAWYAGELQKRGVTPQAYTPPTQTYGTQAPAQPKPVPQNIANFVQAPVPKQPDQHTSQPVNSIMQQANSLGLSYYGFGRFGKEVKGVHVVTHKEQNGKLVPTKPTVNQMTEEQMKNDPCWSGYEMIGKKKKKGRMVPNCVPIKESGMDKKFKRFAEEHGAGFEGTSKLRNRYIKDTPGETLPGRTAVSSPFFEQAKDKAKKKILKKKLNQEDNSLALGYEFGNNGIGPTFSIPRSPSGTGIGYSIPQIAGYVSESVNSWANSSATMRKFTEKYGELAEQKIVETALRIMEWQQEPNEKGLYSGRSVDEESPAWQRKEGKNPEGGLNRKGIASYRRANPGSKLSLAVTTKPSKLKKGSKAAKRRKSFCARMSGMKRRLTSAKTARDPNSRINKSLRKWNCEE